MDAVPPYLDLARRHGVTEAKLRFVDRVSNNEVPLWIRAFDLAVAPFPNTEHYAYFMSPLKIFEYMAAAVPIVASDLPSIREILRHGENAWLVEPGSPSALAEGMRSLFCDRPLLGKIAKEAQHDAEKYTWKRRASAILHYLSQQP